MNMYTCAADVVRWKTLLMMSAEFDDKDSYFGHLQNYNTLNFNKKCP